MTTVKTSETNKPNGYELSRRWFDYCFENPEKINPNHSAIYFFAIEHCNRLGWKSKFGLPTTMVMEAVGIKSYNTYIKALRELIDMGFIDMIKKSTNQYSANVVALSNTATAKNVKALDKAITKHLTKQLPKQRESNCSIVKPVTSNQEPLTEKVNFPIDEFSKNIQEVLKDWLEYKNYKYKPVGFKSLKTKLKNDIKVHGEEKMISCIVESISKNWKGITITDSKISNKQTAGDQFEWPADMITGTNNFNEAI